MVIFFLERSYFLIPLRLQGTKKILKKELCSSDCERWFTWSAFPFFKCNGMFDFSKDFGDYLINALFWRWDYSSLEIKVQKPGILRSHFHYTIAVYDPDLN